MFPALVGAPLVIAGCLGDGTPPATAWTVAQDFNSSPARSVAVLSSGCGHCGPSDKGLVPYADHYAVLILGDHRALLVEWNSAPGGEGLVLDANITYDADELARRLAALPRAESAHLEVVRLTTGRAEDGEALFARLAASWRAAGQPEECVDCAFPYYRYSPAPGEDREQLIRGSLRAGDPFLGFVDTMAAVEEAMRGHGHVEGIPRPG